MAARSRNVSRMALVALLLIVIASVFFSAKLTQALEWIRFEMHPSAEGAYELGERHFDYADPQQYDLDLAEYYFNTARHLDPNLEYVYHELARISFLEGHLRMALFKINYQIAKFGDKTPNSYYVRGLIEGYLGDYTASDTDYKHFIAIDVHDWAAKNDDAWVLLKAKRYQDAFDVTTAGLQDDPNNPWLLNSNAIALYEMGRYGDAAPLIERAAETVTKVTAAEWSHAYPGNDPLIAPQGLAAFRSAVLANRKMIEDARAAALRTGTNGT